jgi:4-hydroxyphenylacetate 3-monooxygenase oxygenase component
VALSTSVEPAVPAQGALTGERYRHSLKDGRQVWLNGERVDVTTHPAFAGILNELGRLYDLQHLPEYRDLMTFVSPESGNRVSRSYQLPATMADLLAKRGNAEVWMKQSWGQLGRAPDFMANVVVGLYDFRTELRGNDPRFGDNAVEYHRYAREHDLSITHAIGDPQVDRSSGPLDDPDLALRVVRETAEGILIRGAKQLATLGPLANEVLVYLSSSYAARESREYVLWFALPVATPGLKMLCREPLSGRLDGHRHPLASRFDEQDAMLFFDDVLVPWERVFLLYDGQLALRGLARINAWSNYSTSIRFLQRLEVFIGVAALIAESIGRQDLREVQDQLGELATYAELLRQALRGAEADACETPGGLLAPASTRASGIFAQQISGRMVEVLRHIGTSGILMQPSEADLANEELRPYLDRYMRGRDIGVAEKSRLFRLAWDLTCDGFGARWELYEYLHRGDITRNRINLFASYDRGPIVERIRRLIAQPLPE